MEQLTLKTSTIFIAKDGETHVFRSVEEVPEEWRAELDETTNGFNSATILIADTKGREEIIRALQGLPTILRTRIEATLEPVDEQVPVIDPMFEAEPPPDAATLRIRALKHFLQHNWPLLLLPIGAGIASWLAFYLP